MSFEVRGIHSIDRAPGSRKRLRLRLSILCAGIGLLALAFGAAVLPRVRYYLEQASFHDAMAQSHRSKAQAYQHQIDQEASKDDDLSYVVEEEEKSAYHHAQLMQQYRRAAVRFWDCPPGDIPLPYPWDRDRDRRVLEAVLQRIIDEATSSDNAAPDHEPREPTIIVNKVTQIGEFEYWYSADILKSEVPPIDVAADLQRRNTEGPVPLAEFRFRSRQIVIDDLDELRTDALQKHPGGVAFIGVSLPGYSRDGRIAVVAVTLKLSQHGGGEVFALVLVNGKWQVAGTELDARE